jgi:beta-glucanase (GH16 family)
MNIKNILLVILFISIYNFSLGQPYINCEIGVKTIYEDDAPLTGGEHWWPTYTWHLVFADEFEGNTLDTSKWKLPYQGMIRDFDRKDEMQWYANTGTTPYIPISNNIEISNGTLKLITKKETEFYGTYVINFDTNPWTYKTTNFEYTSAQIESKQKFGYGRYEIRCKIPKGKGFWPAFWLFGNSRANEIDILEFWNERDCANVYYANRLSKNPHFNIHYNFNVGGDTLDCLSDLCGCADLICFSDAADFSEDFHTFTMIWDYYTISWFIDDGLYRITKKFPTYDENFNLKSQFLPSIFLVEKAYPQE